MPHEHKHVEHKHVDVTVIGCRQLKGEWKLHADPYVVISYGGQTHKTKTDKHHGRDPTFNQTLHFEIKGEPYELLIEVRDNDPNKEEILAYGKVDFGKVLEEDRIKGLYPLHGGVSLESIAHHGDIELDIKVREQTNSTGAHAKKEPNM